MLTDKIVQPVVVAVRNVIDETDFLGFACGWFGPGRSRHDAREALAVGRHRRKMGAVREADIRAFFDTIIGFQHAADVCRFPDD